MEEDDTDFVVLNTLRLLDTRLQSLEQPAEMGGILWGASKDERAKMDELERRLAALEQQVGYNTQAIQGLQRESNTQQSAVGLMKDHIISITTMINWFEKNIIFILNAIQIASEKIEILDRKNGIRPSPLLPGGAVREPRNIPAPPGGPPERPHLVTPLPPAPPPEYEPTAPPESELPPEYAPGPAPEPPYAPEPDMPPPPYTPPPPYAPEPDMPPPPYTPPPPPYTPPETPTYVPQPPQKSAPIWGNTGKSMKSKKKK